MGAEPWMTGEWLRVRCHFHPAVLSQRHSQSPRRCPNTAQTSWVQIRRLNSDQQAAYREMLCSGEASALHFGVCEGLSELCNQAAVSCCTRGDGAGKGPINFNTSMHRRSRRIKRRAEIKHGVGHCSFCLGKEQLVLWMPPKCTCRVEQQSPAAVKVWHPHLSNSSSNYWQGS